MCRWWIWRLELVGIQIRVWVKMDQIDGKVGEGRCGLKGEFEIDGEGPLGYALGFYSGFGLGMARQRWAECSRRSTMLHWLGWWWFGARAGGDAVWMSLCSSGW